MIKGKVKFFDDKKGFGFITGEDGQDYFVHFSEIISDEKRKSLESNQEVEFEALDQARGQIAVNVKKQLI